MRRLVIIATLCVGCLAANAQTFTQRLQKSNAGEGKVTVTQSKEIDDLVNGPQDVVTQSSQTTPTTQKTQTTPTTQKTPTTSTTQKPDSAKSEEKEKPQPSERPQITTLPDTTPDTTYTEPRKKVLKGYKVNGYRVQVYAGGNSRDARVKAERTGREINALFPGEPVYVHFYSPRWICRMGNYRTYEEAHQILNAVKKLGYQSAIIVKGKITVPYLSPAPQTTTTDNP